jgi:hypothetical protein
MAQQTADVGFRQKAGADYTDQQNTTFGFWNAKGQFLFPDLSGQYTSPATQPQFNVRRGGDASQLARNAENKTVFAAANLQSDQVIANKRSWTAPIFKSHQDLLKYIQGQYTQQLPGTPNAPKNYSVNTLFPSNL